MCHLKYALNTAHTMTLSNRAQGMRKEGLGVYTYPSGARYEGEWRDNLKDGRGVYYYPQASRRNTC